MPGFVERGARGAFRWDSAREVAEPLFHQLVERLPAGSSAKLLLRRTDALFDQLAKLGVHVDRSRKQLRPALEDRRSRGCRVKPKAVGRRKEQLLRELGIAVDPLDKVRFDLYEGREHRHLPNIGTALAALKLPEGRGLVPAAARAAAAPACTAAEARLRRLADSGEDRELAADIRSAAIRTVGLVAVPHELLEVRLTGHAHVLVDRHRLVSLPPPARIALAWYPLRNWSN